MSLGFTTHLALDALTHRGMRLLWPLPARASAGLCKTGGVVDACLLVAALALAAVVIWTALG